MSTEPESLQGAALSAFVAAVEGNDPNALAELFQKHPELRDELNHAHFDEAPAVVCAAKQGQRELIEQLLSLGADINARSAFWGRTIGVLDESPAALHPFLIERGALPELTRFVEAVQEERSADLRTLLVSHPKLRDHVDKPLFPFANKAVVVARKNLELVDALLAHGADINTRSDWGEGGFGVLDDNETEIAVELVARGATLTVHAAAEYGMLDALKEFVEADPSAVHTRGGDGKMPLHVAATVEIIDYLLDHGAEIDARCQDHDCTPAQYLVNDEDRCRRLIERGAQIDLYMAAALGELELITRELADSPEAIHTRVHQQPYDRNREYAPNIYFWKLGFKRSPHQVAKEKGHEAVYQYLMEVSPPNERFINACLCGDEALARELVRDGIIVVSELEERDLTRYADAAWCGQLEAVKLMLELGFPVDTRYDEGPAISGACLFGNLDIIREILRYEPDLTHRNEYGATPLGVTVWASLNFAAEGGDYPESAQALIEAGCEVEDWMCSYGTEAVQAVCQENR